MKILELILILVSICACTCLADIAGINPNWRDPSAFERHKMMKWQLRQEGSGDSCTIIKQDCDAPPEAHADKIAAMFYKKFVRFIFNRKKLQRDGLTNNYVRDIQFQITEEELQRLERSSDIQEMDGLIFDVISKSKDSNLHNIVVSELSYHMSNVISLLATKNGMFVLGGLCFILFIWCISHYSKKGIIASSLLAMLVVSYAITYMQCNDKKVTDKLIKLMEHDQKYCNVGDKPEPGFLNSLRSFFVGTPDSQCISMMREAYSAELDICSPAEVFVVMVAQLNMKYFEEFGHQLIKTYRALTESHWWYEKVFIFFVMMLFIAFLAYVFVKFCLKYGFQYIWQSNNSNAAPLETSIPQQKLTETVEQLKITCDGLAKKIKRRRVSSQPKFIIMEGVSRVQEIKSKPFSAIDKGASGDRKDSGGETDESSLDSDAGYVEAAVAFLKGNVSKEEGDPNSCPANS